MMQMMNKESKFLQYQASYFKWQLEGAGISEWVKIN